MEVVAELGVPLRELQNQYARSPACEGWCCAYGMSEGVTGSDGGGGRLIKVGTFDILYVVVDGFPMRRFGKLTLQAFVRYARTSGSSETFYSDIALCLLRFERLANANTGRYQVRFIRC